MRYQPEIVRKGGIVAFLCRLKPALSAAEGAAVSSDMFYEMVMLGVDLRASPKRPSLVVGLDDSSRVVFIDTFHTNAQLLDRLQTCSPVYVAIGAPLTLPTGLCCLELSCPCDFAVPHRTGRQLELDLARLRISCFFTNKRSIIRPLIYRGNELYRQLNSGGYEVIEVYPHATKVILFGDKVPPKKSAASLPFWKERLSSLVLGLEPYLDALDHNTCDAVLNAYTALLHSRNDTDTLGDAEEGLLVIPRLHG